MGASITAGERVFGGPGLARYMFNWMDDTLSGLVNSSNGAVPCTTSAYFSACHDVHVPRDADVVILDFSVNDWHNPSGPPFLNDVRGAFERLLRKLLNYPNRPAVVLMHAYAYNLVRGILVSHEYG